MCNFFFFLTICEYLEMLWKQWHTQALRPTDTDPRWTFLQAKYFLIVSGSVKQIWKHVEDMNSATEVHLGFDLRDWMDMKSKDYRWITTHLKKKQSQQGMRTNSDKLVTAGKMSAVITLHNIHQRSGRLTHSESVIEIFSQAKVFVYCV